MSDGLDPQIEWVLGLVEKSEDPPLETLPPAEARALYAKRAPALDQEPAPMESVAEKAVGRESRFVRTRFYTPSQTGAPDPLLIYFHGGGWTIGDLETHDRVCRGLAAGAEARVLAVDYALAPEHPFPTAVEDAMIVYRHVVENAADYGIDPGRIAVGGDSAGGNLAAVVTHLARQEGLTEPCFQLLIYPSADIAGSYASRRELADGYLLTSRLSNWFRDNYLPAPIDRADPRVSPLRFDDFAGLPPAHIQTAGFDPLKDEGAAYAAKLEAAGVAVEHAHYPGLIHGYFNMAGAVDAARAAFDDAANALRRALHGA